MRRHYEEVRAEPFGHNDGLCRMDTIRTGFVTGRRYYTAIAIEAYGNGQTSKRRVVSLLNRSKEGVHIDVDYLSHEFRAKITKNV
jgi:hypothetical protein